VFTVVSKEEVASNSGPDIGLGDVGGITVDLELHGRCMIMQ
jgi:hypothetical protein